MDVSVVTNKNEWFLDQLNSSFHHGFSNIPQTQTALKTILEKSGKEFDQLTEDDIRQYNH